MKFNTIIMITTLKIDVNDNNNNENVNDFSNNYKGSDNDNAIMIYYCKTCSNSHMIGSRDPVCIISRVLTENKMFTNIQDSLMEIWL